MRTVQRWIAAWNNDVQIAPKPRGHYPCAFDQQGMEELDQLVEKHPDVTLAQLKEMTGTSASLMAIKKALNKLGYRYKKNDSRKRTKAT